MGVRGDVHMAALCAALVAGLRRAGVPAGCLLVNEYLPGHYRPRKNWDLVVRHPETQAVCAAVEFKGAFRSLDKNFNNRCEEALGSATDAHAAQASGALCAGPRGLFVGYVLFLAEPHPRYSRLVQMLAASPLYSAAACVTPADDGAGLAGFAEALRAHVAGPAPRASRAQPAARGLQGAPKLSRRGQRAVVRQGVRLRGETRGK